MTKLQRCFAFATEQAMLSRALPTFSWQNIGMQKKPRERA